MRAGHTTDLYLDTGPFWQMYMKGHDYIGVGLNRTEEEIKGKLHFSNLICRQSLQYISSCCWTKVKKERKKERRKERRKEKEKEKQKKERKKERKRERKKKGKGERVTVLFL